MAYVTREFHPAFEEYCETIFELAEDGIDVIQARIVERLEVSRPAVSEMIKKMVMVNECLNAKSKMTKTNKMVKKYLNQIHKNKHLELLEVDSENDN